MSYTNLLIHIVFATKDRRPYLRNDVRPAVHAYMIGILKNLKAFPVALNGVEDHVHMLVDISATTSIADLVRTLKTNSSRWVHESHGHMKDFAWQTKYGGFSVSSSNKDSVRRYIENQEEHHRKKTFEEEFRELLKKHGVEFDETGTQGSRPGLTECRAFGAGSWASCYDRASAVSSTYGVMSKFLRYIASIDSISASVSGSCAAAPTNSSSCCSL
jgi:putative transposase